MQETIKFLEWLHDRYIPWGERDEEKLFLPFSSPDGIALTPEEVVLDYYNETGLMP